VRGTTRSLEADWRKSFFDFRYSPQATRPKLALKPRT
jgi:hypothetical protein